MTQQNRTPKVYGYCRISTPQQSIERQVRNIVSSYPDAQIVQEAFTGTTMNRPGWVRLIARVRPGDTIVFDSVSRLARTADEGVSNYMELFDLGVDLVFLKEPAINTSVYRESLRDAVPMTGTEVDLILSGVNEYLRVIAKKQIRIAFDQAEKEVLDLRQRTKEGIETARLQGKQIGQREGATLHTKTGDKVKAVILQHCKDFGGTLADKDCITLAGCARNTYFRYKKELREAQEETL